MIMNAQAISTIRPLNAPLLALSAARSAMRAGSGEAVGSSRRIARVIGEALRSGGMGELAAAASAVEECDVAELAPLLDRLIDGLEAATQKPDAATGGAILMVEDDRVTSTILGDVLRQEGYEVLVAGTGAAAEALISQHKIGLMLLDLVLPDTDGRALLIRLRETYPTMETPVLILTGKQDSLTQSECFALGVEGFLAKPVHPEVLRSIVAANLERARERAVDSRIDSLTGLPNRASFWEAFERAAKLAARQKHPLTAAIIDLDHFKHVNDTYGHAKGDEVLRVASASIRATLRTTDFVARFGGEEFCVFLPDTDADGAVQALDKVLTALRDEVFTADDGRSFTITFSAGVATVRPGLTTDEVLETADQFLYMAKSAGRNRIVSESDAANPPKPLVIVAEDEHNIGEAIRRRLQREGFDVRVFPDGASALSAATADNVALMICDLHMPVMDGFQLVKHMRGISSLAKVPIIMLTGADTEEDILLAFDLGVSDYVVKPFFTSELVVRIRRLLTRR